MRRSWKGYLFLIPIFVLIGGIFVWPFMNTVWLSFHRSAFGGSAQFIGLENFQKLLADKKFWPDGVRASAIWTVGNLLMQLVIPLFIALLLNERLKGMSVVRAIILIPWLIPGVVVGVRMEYMESTLNSVRTEPDSKLLSAYKASQDQDVFAEIVHRHGQMVYRVCLGILGDPHEAEDASQAVFVVLARRARSLRREANLAAGLLGVARNVSLRALQARSRRAPTRMAISESQGWARLASPWHNRSIN